MIILYNMVVFDAKTRRLGHSLGFIIPNEIAKKNNLKEGQPLKIEMKLKKKKDAFGKFKKAKPFVREKTERDESW